MTRRPQMTEVFERFREVVGADVRVSIPAKVERYDASKRQCDAAPLVKQAYLDEEGERQIEALPVVPNVPVVFPAAGGLSITFPVAVGDTVLLVFSDHSLDKWLAVGGCVDPEDDARHGLSDAIAIPGLCSFANAPAGASGSAVQIGTNGGSFQGVGLGADIETFLTAVQTHTHPTPAGPASASTELATETVPSPSATVTVTP